MPAPPLSASRAPDRQMQRTRSGSEPRMTHDGSSSVVALWTLVGVVWGAQTSLGAALQGDAPLPLAPAIVRRAAPVLPWIPATLVAIALAARFPLTRATWRRHLLDPPRRAAGRRVPARTCSWCSATGCGAAASRGSRARSAAGGPSGASSASTSRRCSTPPRWG